MTSKFSKYQIGETVRGNLIFTQSWLNQFPLLLATAALTALMTYLTFEYPGYSFLHLNSKWGAFDAPILFIVPAVLLMKALYIIYNEKFILTPQYMIHVSGRLNWKERTVRLEYSRIQEIEIDQTILQKIFNLGDVIVLPVAGSSATNIHMHGARSPRMVKDAIREMQSQGASQ